MAEASIVYSQRAIFQKGKQAIFLSKAREKINLPWSVLAQKINIHNRTLNDWKREEYSIPLNQVEVICKMSDLPLPSNIKIESPFWYTKKGAKIGALAALKKYGSVGGDPEYRKKKWYEWWDKKTDKKHGCIAEPLPIKNPHFSKKLAEFTGIILGDGGITNGQVMIFTNMVTDRKYGFFISVLIEELFGVIPSIYFRPAYSLMTIAVSRTKLVAFCNKKLGLKTGHKIKQQIDIPDWIKGNLEYEKACMRGLMDTDGCIFYECHNIKNKKYCYPRLSFVTASEPLRNSVFDILHKLNLNPKIRNVNKRYVQIEDKEDIKKYFKVIGSSNPKHLNRYKNKVL